MEITIQILLAVCAGTGLLLGAMFWKIFDLERSQNKVQARLPSNENGEDVKIATEADIEKAYDRGAQAERDKLNQYFGGEMRQRDERIQTLEQRVDGLVDTVSELQRTVGAQETTIRAQEKQIRERDTAIEGLKEQVEAKEAYGAAEHEMRIKAEKLAEYQRGRLEGQDAVLEAIKGIHKMTVVLQPSKEFYNLFNKDDPPDPGGPGGPGGGKSKAPVSITDAVKKKDEDDEPARKKAAGE